MKPINIRYEVERRETMEDKKKTFNLKNCKEMKLNNKQIISCEKEDNEIIEKSGD